MPSTCAAIDSRARAQVLVRIARAQARRPPRPRARPGRSRCSGSCAAVWSVTRSNVLAAAASSGTTSAAFPSRPTDSGAPLRGRRSHARERVVERLGRLVEVAGVEPPLDPRRIDLDAEDRRAGTSSPRAAARRPCRRARRSGSSARRGRPSRSASRRRPRRSGRCPGGSPACRCRSSCRRSSGRTSSARAPRAGGTRPRSPSAARAASSRSGRAARPRCVRKHADRLAALDEQRLVVAEREQRADDRLQRLVLRARRSPEPP